MHNNPSNGEDPKALWQMQETEPSTMSLEEIHNKAKRLRAKTRLETFSMLVLVATSVAISCYGIVRTNEFGIRLAFALAVVWILIGFYFVNRGMWFRSDSGGEASPLTGIDFYRRELHRRSRMVSRIVLWFVCPFVLTVSTFIFEMMLVIESQHRPIRNLLPFSALFAIWLVAYFGVRSRTRQELRKELDGLEKLAHVHPEE
jgi:FtsH-binding integral membrane protein